MIKEVAFAGYRVTDVTGTRELREARLELTPGDEHLLGSGKGWIDEGLRGLVSAGTPRRLKKSARFLCWLAAIGDSDGNARTINQRRSPS
jgi:hypothetical protein